MTSLRNLYRAAQFVAWLIMLLLGACTSETIQHDCERVRSAVNARYAACGTPGYLKLDCDAANYEDGDVEACVAAIASATCVDVDKTYVDNCNIFSHAGL